MAVATKIVAVTGNQAVAEAFRQLNPDVMPAYPITPSTGIMESFRTARWTPRRSLWRASTAP